MKQKLTYKKWLAYRQHTRKHHKKHISWLAAERKKYSQFVFKHRKSIAATKTFGRNVKSKASTFINRAPIVTQKTRLVAKNFGEFVGRKAVAYKQWQIKRKLAKSGIKTYK